MFKLPLRKLLFIVKLCFLFVLVLITLSLFEYWRGGKRATRAFILDPDEELYEKQILADEARIIHGLGEGGRPAYLTGEDRRLGEEAEKKYAVNTYLSDRIAYNRTLKDFRNPACERVTYDAELPSTSVIIIFHNEPYSVVIRTIWSVLNTARRDQPWHRQANYLERGTGRVMKLGYPGQPEDSEFVYLKEIILVDDNSTLPELRGKLARYVRTRLPPDMVRVLRLPDRLGLTRARHAGARAAAGDVLVFLDSHCEGNTDWLRPLLHRIKHSLRSVLVPWIDIIEKDSFSYDPGYDKIPQLHCCRLGLTRARYAGSGAATGDVMVFLDAHCEGNTDWMRPLLDRLKHSPKIGLTRARLAGARYADGEVLIFLDAHCEGVTDWMRPLLQRIKDSPTAVVMPIIDVVEHKDFFYSVQDPTVFQGLMRARVTGARAARGDVLVFLDAHCEAEKDWLRPLLQRIRHKRDAVPTPVIDVIDQTTFHLDGEDPIQVGGFTFVGHFTWIDIPEREKQRRGSDIAPTWSPTMAGGLFAIRRAYYWELGAYDEQMAGWGGENLEMSFRIWQCGGTLETIPCSRVGHVFRSFHPYGLPANSDTHGINTARMAEVWMDDYAELFYLHRPDLRKNPIIGDVTHRKILREKLHCKSFQWFLDNVYREKFVPVRDSTAFGRVQNMATRLCLDTMQREGEASPLGFYPCHSKLTDTQHLSLSLTGQLRDEERCAEVQFVRRAQDSVDDDVARTVVMVTCRENTAKMQWRYISSTGQLQHVGTELCLDARRARAGDDARARACAPEDTPSQRWAFDYAGEDTSAGVLPAELEQVLGKIRGQRRKSRSLLSVTEEEAAESPAGGAREGGAGGAQEGVAGGAREGDAGGAREGDAGARRHRERLRRSKKKKSSKKIHKNKFIVTIERTLSNSSVEHLEMDIHCKHKRLYPNNTFVRDLVSILNDKDIRVINNGRVFEKNKVTDLDKEHSLRLLEDKLWTTEPPPEKEVEDESTEASTEKLVTTSVAPTTPPSQPAEPDDEVAPLRGTTEKPKPKKHHHKKKHSSSKYEKNARSHEHSLLLSDHDVGEHVAIGSGGNGTGALLPAEGAPNARAREMDDEWERDNALVHIRSGHSRGRHRRPSARELYAYVGTPRPDSAELRRSEDRARADRTRGDLKEVDIRGFEGNELAAARGDTRRPGDGMRSRDEHRLSRTRDASRERARAAAIARHAEFHQLQAGERKWEEARGGSRPEVPSDARTGRPHKERVAAANRDRYISRDGDVPGRHKDRDGSVRRVADKDDAFDTARDSSGHHTDRESPARINDRAHHTPDAQNTVQAERELDRDVFLSPDVETEAWDPWAPRDLAAVGGRKAAKDPHDEVAKDPHDEVAKLVYSDVWQRDAMPRDPRVAELAKQVMMDYEEHTETPVPRAESRDRVEETGSGGAGAARGKALRVRLKSNMTFNLGDELLSWRRMQMTGQESESGSPSDEAEPAIQAV